MLPAESAAKPLRYNQDVELSLLGSLMLEGEFPADMDVEPEHFLDTRHRLIFAACRGLARRGLQPQAATVRAALGDLIDDAVGVAYLREMIEETPYAVNLRSYAKSIREGHAKREVLRVQQTDYGMPDAQATIDAITADLNGIQTPSTVSTVFDAEQASSALMETRADPLRNIPSGVPYLDKILKGGLTPGEVTIIAARPGMGKTTFALNWSMQAVAMGKSVGFLSMEMSAPELAARIIAAETSIPSDQVVDVLNGESKASNRVMQALGDFDDNKDKFIVDQKAVFTPAEIRSRVVGWQSRNLDLLVVDHLQLTAGDDGESKVSALDRTTRELKALAKELDIAVLACSQLNRSIEQLATSRKPMLSDLRDSGALEQNADVVLFLHKPEVKDASKDNTLPVKLDCIIAKNRNGGLGSAGMAFWRHHSKIVQQEPGQAWGEW